MENISTETEKRLVNTHGKTKTNSCSGRSVSNHNTEHRCKIDLHFKDEK